MIKSHLKIQYSLHHITMISPNNGSLLDMYSEVHNSSHTRYSLLPWTHYPLFSFAKQNCFTFRPWTSHMSQILLSVCMALLFYACLTLSSSSQIITTSPREEMRIYIRRMRKEVFSTAIKSHENYGVNSPPFKNFGAIIALSCENIMSHMCSLKFSVAIFFKKWNYF